MAISDAAVAAGFTSDAFQAFLRARREPAWLTDARTRAWETFLTTPMPDRREESWRRTDLRPFRLDQFAIPGPANTIGRHPEPLLAEGVELAGQALTVDSTPAGASLAYAWREQGVLFGSLDELASPYEDRVKPYLLRQVVDPGEDKFAALAAACFRGGTLLHVPAGVVVSQPLHVLSALTPGGVNLGRTLVVLEKGAEATLLAETASTDPAAPGLHCGLLEILVGPGARLRFVNLQNWGRGVWHFAHQKALVHAAGHLQWTVGALGSRLAKVNQHVTLTGPQADAQLNGAMVTQGRQHLAYHTRQHHEAPQGHSDLLCKGALQDRSSLVWRGMIRVDPDGQKTDAYQRNDNLMLSDAARADSIPGLEIEADDVRCSHGATAGRVDDEMIFYCQSRGLTRNEAARMIVAGFFQQVFDRITLENVRRALAQAIRSRVRQHA